jgi:hypothetical protein
MDHGRLAQAKMAIDEDTVELPIVSSYYSNYPARREPSSSQAVATVSVSLIIVLALLVLLWGFL